MFESIEQQPSILQRCFVEGQPVLRARWIWLRALGGIFFSAFFSLWFQIHGLIGPHGILPARDYLVIAKSALGVRAYWYIPSLLWIDASDAMLTTIVVAGFLASIALMLNLLPRASIAVAALCFLSFVAAAQDFSGYQSDGMLLEAALLSMFFAPRGLRPGFGIADPPTKASLFLLQWEGFRIWFESGLVKILSGEPQWRNLTAMDHYYENGPLPTWIGWYVQQWPHAFHATTAAMTLVFELFVVWLLFLPKRSRLICFLLTTPLQIGIILTANYAFLNYLVLCLGILLLGDRDLRFYVMLPTRTRPALVQVVVLPLFFVTSIAMFFVPSFAIARLLAPSRVVNNYGLFAVMTPERYEIEFQGTRDGKNWTPYPFKYKPQDVRKAPGVYAPYQPRFEWNLWFASLDAPGSNPWILSAQAQLLEGSPPVLQLFEANPFGSRPPTAVRTVLWQYWFTTREERRRTGAWWRREFRGEFTPPLQRAP